MALDVRFGLVLTVLTTVVFLTTLVPGFRGMCFTLVGIFETSLEILLLRTQPFATLTPLRRFAPRSSRFARGCYGFLNIFILNFFNITGGGFNFYSKMSKHRAFQFTWNNYTDAEVEHLKGENYKYLIFGYENCPSTGTPHLQGMIVFSNPRSFDNVRKKIFLERAHMEPVRSMDALKKYNMKDGNYVELGEPPAQGRRVDIEEMVELASKKSSLREMWGHNPTLMCQYRRSLDAARYDFLEDRKGPPEVYWYWGSTGTGKTSTAVDGAISFYMKDGTPWWDGYMQQECIIIDDFDGLWPLRDLLRLLDRYPYQGQVKGGYVRINSPIIYITCQFHPSEFWSGPELAQILRRISDVRAFNTVKSVVVDHRHGTEVSGNTIADTL